MAPLALEFETSLVCAIGQDRVADLDDMLRKLEAQAELLTKSASQGVP